MTDTTELVVPRSMPIIFAIELLLAFNFICVVGFKEYPLHNYFSTFPSYPPNARIALT
jgi:hypothetical protein